MKGDNSDPLGARSTALIAWPIRTIPTEAVLHQAGLNTLDGASYTYDAVGNRLSSVGVANYGYNSSNELTSNSNGSYTYDANGNTLSDAQGRSFTWDLENRLVQAVVSGTNGGTTTFRYDPFGRRIQKSGPLGATNYLYDGTSIVDELDNSGNALARYAATTDVDEPLAEFRSGTSSYYHADGMGSVTSLTNVSATTAASYDYDALGNLSGSTGTLTNPYRFTAREFDVETGVYHYRARYYSPVAGRFLSGDPAGFSGGINLYVYVGNRPTNWVDPFGLRPGDKYPTLRCAGWNAIRDINTTSRQRTPAFPNGREYGGWMYENSDGTYSYTAPVPGGPSGVDPHNFNPVPPNAVRAGDYHTHGAYDPNFNLPGNPQPGQPGYNWHNDGNEVFSPDDKAGNEAEGYLPGFLGTPQGTTEEYIPVLGHPGSGQVVVLSGRNCGCH